jgi:hypothetical protein
MWDYREARGLEIQQNSRLSNNATATNTGTLSIWPNCDNCAGAIRFHAMGKSFAVDRDRRFRD